MQEKESKWKSLLGWKFLQESSSASVGAACFRMARESVWSNKILPRCVPSRNAFRPKKTIAEFRDLKQKTEEFIRLKWRRCAQGRAGRNKGNAAITFGFFFPFFFYSRLAGRREHANIDRKWTELCDVHVLRRKSEPTGRVKKKKEDHRRMGLGAPTSHLQSSRLYY